MSLDLVKQISKSTLKKYKKRTFENNNTKSLALLKNEPEKYSYHYGWQWALGNKK